MQSGKLSMCYTDPGRYSSSVTHSSHLTCMKYTEPQTEHEWERKPRRIYSSACTRTHTSRNSIIKRVGGMPWEPTGVCLWGRRGQVWGHTSSVSAERRVDHTNSIMATNTAIMRPQISTTKMPPMFSMPRPEGGPQGVSGNTVFQVSFFFFTTSLFNALVRGSTGQVIKETE